jgi:hypothetical protein
MKKKVTFSNIIINDRPNIFKASLGKVSRFKLSNCRSKPMYIQLGLAPTIAAEKKAKKLSNWSPKVIDVKKAKNIKLRKDVIDNCSLSDVLYS